MHLIAEGTVKLVAHTNPFSSPEINTQAQGEKASYESNPNVSNNKSGGQGTLCASISQN